MKTKTRFHKLTAWLLTLAMLMTFIPSFTLSASAAEITPSQPSGGDGSEGDPYQITTAAELYWFAEHVNAGNASACAKLMNDITVNENVIVNGALNSDPSGFAAWTPIGKIIASNNIKAFSGTFDGNNKTISGLYVSATSGYQGLIGFMESGTVKNVTVANSYFSGTKNIGAVVGCYGQTETASIVTNCHNVGSIVIASDYYAGGVVGGRYAPVAKNAKIVVSGCSNSGSVTGAQFYVGGIIGYAAYFSEGKAISDCTNTGTVTNTSTSRAQGTGGIAGYFGGSSDAKVEIVNCTNSGKISIADGGQQDYMGGIIGQNSYGYISYCNNTGTISGYLMAGGIVGSNSGTVANCQNTGAVSGTGSKIGGVVGSNGGTVTDCTNSAAVQGQWYVGGINGYGTGLSRCTNTGDVTSNTYGAGGVIGYVDAAGTVENCHNEGKVKGSSYYIGGLVGYHYSGKVTYTECSNKGDVEGSSYDIGGLFGRITDSSKVTQCYNTGKVTCTGTYSTSFDHGVGGLAGATYNAAMFENCYNTGAVNGGSNENVGGLVGFFTYASGSTDHYIKNSYNTGSVTGGKNTGGLCGSYEAMSVSENCYNTGAVIGGQNTGGLVGYHQSTGSGIGVIKNCYNIGSVSGTYYVGGLFGYQFYDNCLETSYNVGPVSGTSNIGGVIGNSNMKSVTNCYYLDTSVTVGNTVTGATALTAEQMTDDANWQTNYAGFDTTTPVWSKQNNENATKYLPKLNSYSPTLHIHNWTYSTDSNTITATCNVDGCSNPNGGSVTITAPSDLVYSGSSKDAACNYSNWLPDKEGTIVYNTVDRINVTGEVITASITIGEATASVSYQITPREITTSMVTLSPSSATYDGSEKTVTVTVKYSSTTLTAGTDYEFTGITSATEISTGDGYAVTVTGKGNYTGTVTKYWKINKGSLNTQLTLEGWSYLDTPNNPSVTNNPEEGEVTYTYYISIGRGATETDTTHGAETEGGVPKYAGTYYIGAVIAETEHYKRKIISPVEFTIAPREVTNPTFDGLQATYPYDNGNEIKPTFTLKDDLGNEIPASEYTVSYSNNTNCGEATITITDAAGGNYNVSGNKTFEIVTHSHEWTYALKEGTTNTIEATCGNQDGKCPNTDGGSVIIAAPDSLVYTGNAIEAKVTNTLTTGDTVTVVYTPTDKLTDGEPVNAGEYTASITIGGKEISVTYTIKPSYQITASSLNTAGGSVTGGGRYEENTSVTLTATANNGYIFAGWTENGELIENAGASYTFTATGNRTLVAVFVKLHTITVNLNGGTLTDAANAKIEEYKAQGISVVVDSANDVLTAEIPDGTEVDIKIADGKSYVTKSGFGFVGFKSSDNKEYKTDTKITVSADETYTLLWEEISSYSVTFNTNGGTSVGGQTVEDGSKITEPTAPTKTGYTFGGWYKEAALTTEWNFESDTVTGETTLYAKWIANTNTTYIVKHWVQTLDAAKAQNNTANETNYTLYKTENLTGTTDASVNKTITIEGFKFPEESAKTFTISADGTTIHNYYYTRNKYNITINTDAGIEISSGANQYYYDEMVSISATLKSGYKWTEWVANKNGYGSENIAYSFKMPATALVLTPKTTSKAIVTINTDIQSDNTYDKTAKAFEIRGTSLTGFTVSYKQGETPVAEPTNAGTYDVIITRPEDDSYKAYSNTIAGGLVINKAQVSVPTVSSKVYTGETLKADISNTADYTITKNDGGIAVGQHDVILTLIDNANYKWADGTETAAVTIKFAITKAGTNTISNLSIEGWTYGETAKTPTASATFGTPSFTYEGTGDTVYAESTTPPSNAGTYKVIAKVADTNNFAGAEYEKAFTISKATPSYTVPTNLTATYGQTLANVQGLTTGFAFMAENTTSVGNAGNNTFELKFTPADTNNYNVVENIDATVVVAPKEIGIEWGNTEFTYNKTEQKPAATATGLVLGDICTITVTGGRTNAGNGYTATAQSLSNANYKLPASKTTTFNIAKRSVTITGVTIADTKVYDRDTDASITNYGSVSNVVDGDIVTVDHTSARATYNDKNVGNSKTVTFAGFAITGTNAANYVLSGQPESQSANITPKAVTITGVTVAPTKTYDANATASIINYGLVDGVISGDTITVNSEAAAATYSDANAGTDKAVTFTGFAITGADTENYELSAQPASTTANITAKDITGAEITLGTALTYNGSELTQTIASATIDGLAITYNVSGNVNTNAGEYTLTIEGYDNFTGTEQKTYTIAKADATLGTAPAAITPLTYNTAEQTLVSAGENVAGGTLMYKLGDGEYSAELPKATNVGTYTVYYKVVGDSNHNDIAEQSFTVAIAEKVVNTAIVLATPAPNQTPVTSIETDEYTAVITWSPTVEDKFAYSTDYTATIIITPKANYTLTGIAENGYTIEGATVTNSADSGVITAVFPKTGSRPSSGGGGVTRYTVKFDTDGGSSVANKTVTRNSKVAEPEAPEKEGYTFMGWFADEDFATTYDFDSKVTKNITLYAKWEKVDDEKPGNTDAHNCPSKAFDDLDISAWYHLDTDYVLEKGIFRGISEKIFEPNSAQTRAMMVTVLWRIENEPVVNYLMTFEDADAESWYGEAVRWAASEGIIKGYSETEFGPDDSITREQIAAIMHRYAKYKGYDVSVGENTNILSYNDFDNISEYAIAPMQWAVGSGLIKGKSESTLNPLDNATRAEIAAILHRYIEANK